MKKILFAIAFVMMVVIANAQTDGFFKSGDTDSYTNRTEGTTPIVPTGPVGTLQDTNAPLGSGLIILTAMGAGYAIARRKK